MNYANFEFLLFSAAVVLLYYLAGKKLQKYVLLLANAAFYLIAGAKYIPFIAVSILTTFFCAKKISGIWKKEAVYLDICTDISQEKEIRAASKASAKKYLMLAFFIIIGMLAVCKYSRFVAENINRVLASLSVKQIPTFRMVLPIGIAFYTFMAISYLLDVYRKRYEAENSLLLYAVYQSYFPHVIQGPIDRYDKFSEQLRGGVALNEKNLVFGAELVLWGLFKKLVIADRLGLFVDTIYNGWEEYTGVVFALATALYTIQIYADYSGCIDIVSGVSEMMGIKLTRNFNHPFFSKTMPESWRRWHISLTEWFKDYIVSPISTSQFVQSIEEKRALKDKKRTGELFASCFPAFVAWTVMGVWYGARWTFLVWGLYHACLIILGNIFRNPLKKLNTKLNIDSKTFSWKLWQMIRTFILCPIGSVFFRAENLKAAFGIFRRSLMKLNLAGVWGAQLYTYGLDRNNFTVAIISILILLIVDMLQERMPVRKTIAKQNLVFRWLLIYAAVVALLIFGMYGPGYDANAFIFEII